MYYVELTNNTELLKSLASYEKKNKIFGFVFQIYTDRLIL